MIFNTTHALGNMAKGEGLGCRNQASARGFCPCRHGNWIMWYIVTSVSFLILHPFPQFFMSCSRMTIYVTLTTSGSLLLYCSLADPPILPQTTQVMDSHQVCFWLVFIGQVPFSMPYFLSQRTFSSFLSVSLSFDSPSTVCWNLLIWSGETRNYPWFLATRSAAHMGKERKNSWLGQTCLRCVQPIESLAPISKPIYTEWNKIAPFPGLPADSLLDHSRQGLPNHCAIGLQGMCFESPTSTMCH